MAQFRRRRYNHLLMVETSSWLDTIGRIFDAVPDLATIYVPSPADWDARIPWAAGRRDEVLATLAREVSRQKCRGCTIEIAERWIHLREAPPLMRRVAGAWRRFLGSLRESG